jgi:hypothetical protein
MVVLAGPSFHLLDARDSLHLVTSFVDEDDGLSIALTCRLLQNCLDYAKAYADEHEHVPKLGVRVCESNAMETAKGHP